MAEKPENLNVIEHPLIMRDVTIIRDKNSGHEQFRNAVNRIANVLASEIMKKAELEIISVETPLETTFGYGLKSQVILIPVLRAGLGMVSGFITVIPDAKVGHVGIQRNEETLEPLVYYSKVPVSIPDAMVIVLDPMLATGGSSASAINYLKTRGAKSISFACLVASPEGVRYLFEKHPDVEIYTAAFDRELNEKGYILPGLGDAGDRMFGTL
ncbi:MAG: uracil phosphoribosyltransferase [Ignavibacteriales bacterium]|nr:uracil phosphoribosyltransferase [Ignavibacteriales bacterium]